jgi:DNA (cytosine-5)-methyltransferase 1
MLRVISELKPTWVIGENVAGFVNMGLEDACADLEGQGYAVQPFIIPACGVGAWHERKRVFIVAHNGCNGGKCDIEEKVSRKSTLQGRENIGGNTYELRRAMLFEPKLCRNLHGFSNGSHRLKCLGNSIVPQQIYPIFKAIADIESGGVT